MFRILVRDFHDDEQEDDDSDDDMEEREMDADEVADIEAKPQSPSSMR